MSQPVLQSHPSLPMNESQCGLALLDADGRLEWTNNNLAAMLGTTPEALIGKATGTLPAEARAWFSDNRQPMQWLDAQGGVHPLRIERHDIGDKTLVALHDITVLRDLRAQNEHLQRRLLDLKLNDDLTGLPNRRAITQALELQISRSRRYDNPLSIILVQIGLQDEHIELVRESADVLVLGVSRFLRDRLRWVDQIGRWDQHVFLVVLPETTLEDARGLVNKIHNELQELELPAPLQAQKPRLDFGIGIWEKGDDLRTLLRSASQDLADA